MLAGIGPYAKGGWTFLEDITPPRSCFTAMHTLTTSPDYHWSAPNQTRDKK